MLAENPNWRFRSQFPLTQWYDHVHLLSQHVVGQWLCLERETGRLLWQKRFFRPNNIRGIDSGVIAASEMRSDGPWTFDFGCYGISLDSGKLLWASHRDGLFGTVVRWLDAVPCFTNELRDAPHHVADGKCYCASGRILDIKTGRKIGHIPVADVEAFTVPPSEARTLYSTSHNESGPPAAAGEGLWLTHPPPPREQRSCFDCDFRLMLVNELEKPVWSFSLAERGRHIDGNYYSYRYVFPEIYLIVSEESRYRPHPTNPQHVVRNATRWHLLTLDVTTGWVVQEFPLSPDDLTECRIEDADSRGVLISTSNHELMYHIRQ